jgi:hypothetical protein
MSVRSIVVAAFIATAVPLFAQPPAGSEPRGRGPEPAQAPRGGPATTPQARTAEPQRASTQPPGPPRPVGQPVNVRVDVTITDQRGGSAPLKKTVSVVVADGRSGRIRSSAEYANIPPVPLNVDAEAEIVSEGKIRVMVNLQYDLPGAASGSNETMSASAGPLRRTLIQENLPLVLENGKVLLAAQSADPVGDRQVTIEVKATVLR